MGSVRVCARVGLGSIWAWFCFFWLGFGYIQAWFRFYLGSMWGFVRVRVRVGKGFT